MGACATYVNNKTRLEIGMLRATLPMAATKVIESVCAVAVPIQQGPGSGSRSLHSTMMQGKKNFVPLSRGQTKPCTNKTVVRVVKEAAQRLEHSSSGAPCDVEIVSSNPASCSSFYLLSSVSSCK